MVAEPVDADDELRNLAVEPQGGCGAWLEHGLPLIAPLGMNLLKWCVAKFLRAGAISESHSVTVGHHFSPADGSWGLLVAMKMQPWSATLTSAIEQSFEVGGAFRWS